MKFQAGQIVYVTAGSYSSYSVIGLAIVKMNFDASSMLNEYDPKRQKAGTEIFKFLLDKGYLEEIDGAELETGSY